MSTHPNPVGLRGLAFVEYATNNPAPMDGLFKEMGFSRVASHSHAQVDLYRQKDIVFLVDHQPGSYADAFQKAHGPAVSGLGLLVNDASFAFEEAVRRGARPFDAGQGAKANLDLPAVYGIGDALMYFVDDAGMKALLKGQFKPLANPEKVPEKGFYAIDHLTNNVYKGTMVQWADYYKTIFGFYEIRYFDIRGKKTGLFSYALKSPCGTFSIPINEGTETKSQIEEYLREYKGPGVQHIALATHDLIDSMEHMQGGPVAFLDIEDGYYETVFDRVPNVSEDHKAIHRLQILVDGDEEGYLLQIFTRNVIGPIFFEMIQRKNHHSFGEGNFGALFRSIERDQERRGVL